MAVIDSILAHAASTPGRVALIYNGVPISYRTLAACIAQARAFLVGQPLQRDRVAVLCIDDLFDACIVGLALRSLGVSTVNGRSIEGVAGLDLGPVSLIGVSAAPWPDLGAFAARQGWPLIWATNDWRPATGPTVDWDEPSRAEADLGGHILLTSGTTGGYKMVLIDAVAEAALMRSQAELAGVTPETAINIFSFGGWAAAGYFWPSCAWTLGGQIIMHSGPEPWRSLASIDRSRHTLAITTPHLVAGLLASPAALPPRNDAMTLYVVGGALSVAQWRSARERLTRDVRSIYGATETWLMTATPLETEDDLRWHRVNPQCEVQIVDEQDRPLAAGQVGALRMRPIRVDQYLNDPVTTRAFFREGYFYPGDLGVLRADGRLSLQGRVTDVINVLGEKTGVLPIEADLQDRLGARAVCVFSLQGDRGDEIHVAIQFGRPIGRAELTEALRAALPAGAAQAQVHAVRDFARNHMGKIDRAELMRELTPRRSSDS